MKLPDKKIALPVIIFLLIVIAWASFTAEKKIHQPIKYNHKVHIDKAGLDCIDCHKNVEKLPRATIPNIDICQDCHGDEPITNSPEEKKLLQYISKNQKIPWVQIYSVADHVYFSHRRHVTIGKLKCTECHGDVAELTEPASWQLVKITMNNCIDCHKKHDVVYDCIGCHR